MSFTVAQIAEQLRGEVVGNGSIQLTGFASADNARPGDLTFADKEEYFVAAEASPAAAILVSGAFTSTTKAVIRGIQRPHRCRAIVAGLFSAG